jgi:rare lipoprotein A (peptidoglycan hydrolase)
MERHHLFAPAAPGERRRHHGSHLRQLQHPRRRRRQGTALAGLLASAALVSAACSGNPHPVPAPAQPFGGAVVHGMASWYGPGFDGRRTASGERYDKRNLTAAHPSLPFGTLVQVTNLENGRQVVVRINDRGPFGHRRVIDLSYAAAHELRMVGAGTARVELAVLGKYDPRDTRVPEPAILLAAAPVSPRPWPESAARPVAAGDAPAGEPAMASAPPAPTAPTAPTAPASAEAADTAAPGDAVTAGAATADAATRGATPADPTPTAVWATRTTAAALHYTVQVGAFGEAERAEALQQDLVRRYPEAAVHSDGIWNRVQVGRFGDRERAETLRQELASLGMAAIVVAAR